MWWITGGMGGNHKWCRLNIMMSISHQRWMIASSIGPARTTGWGLSPFRIRGERRWMLKRKIIFIQTSRHKLHFRVNHPALFELRTFHIYTTFSYLPVSSRVRISVCMLCTQCEHTHEWMMHLYKNSEEANPQTVYRINQILPQVKYIKFLQYINLL